MAKNKRKGRCVKKNIPANSEEPEEVKKAPHSFVLHRGLPCPFISDLTRDYRKMMEPFTASSLRERKSNKVKDFVSLSGVFHVSHMCVFNKAEHQLSLKVARLPRGPTLHFKIHQFSLTRDVRSLARKQFVEEDAFQHPPLVIMNNFIGEGKHLKLMANTFQNMFPTINVATASLAKIKRCVMFSYNPITKLIDLRHYAIRVVPLGLTRGIKKVVLGKVPDLSKCNDISDFVTQTAGMSESEYEDDEASEVVLPQSLPSRGNMANNKSAVRLYELGPRLTIQLMKIEEGLYNGEVLFNDMVVKTEAEKEKLAKQRVQKQRLKETRKKIQNENKEKKDQMKEDMKQKSLAGMYQNAADKTGEDDAEYYRDAVGEEPEQELFDGVQNMTRKRPYMPKGMKMQQNKRRKVEADGKPGSHSHGDKKPFRKSFDKPDGDKKPFRKSFDKPSGDKKSFNKNPKKSPTGKPFEKAKRFGTKQGKSSFKKKSNTKGAGNNKGKGKKFKK